MNLIKNFIQQFLDKSGSYVFLATVFAKIISFTASWLALKLVPNKELGTVLFAYNIIIFLLPIGGFGLNQSLLRYGALLKNLREKNNLFVYVLKKGILASLTLIILIIGISSLITFEFPNTNFYIIVLSFLLITSFVFEIVRTQLRLQLNNKKFAYSELLYSIVLIISVFILGYYLGALGYALALLITPFLTSLPFLKDLKIESFESVKLSVTNFTFWKYGFFASMSNVITQLLFVIDILLIGYILNNELLVTSYRYISLIPFSLLFVPRVFINTDFVAFTENIFDKKYITNYSKSYMLFFLSISVVILIISYLFSDVILSLLDKEFVVYVDSFLILMIGICGIYIFRGLYGNLLSSIGKAKANYYIGLLCLILNISLNLYLIPKFGLLGAATTTAIIMWLSGFLSLIIFNYLYKIELAKQKST